MFSEQWIERMRKEADIMLVMYIRDISLEVMRKTVELRIFFVLELRLKPDTSPSNQLT
jgi:hypothetical protein